MIIARYFLPGTLCGILNADPEEELPCWRKALAPVAVEWAKEVPNGAKALAAFRQEVKAYNAQGTKK